MGHAPSVISRRGFVLISLTRLLLGRAKGAADFTPPADMVLLPGSDYLMGTDREALAGKYAHLGTRVLEMLRCETPRHRVMVPALYMDRCEVTNRKFREFVRACPEWSKAGIAPEYHNGDYLKHWDGDRIPPGADDKPVIYVSWFAAMAYAGWAGKRLPLESEWEYGARGGLADAEYPWGDEPPSANRANFSGSNAGGVVTVGRHRPNGFGLYDMAGNAWEYCLDPWQCSYEGPTQLPDEASISWLVHNWTGVRTRRVIRGGSWQGVPVNLRVAFRDSHPPEGAGPHVGFRCVLPVP